MEGGGAKIANLAVARGPCTIRVKIVPWPGENVHLRYVSGTGRVKKRFWPRKTEVYGKRKNHTQTLRNKGLSKITFWLGKNEGSRQDATRDACSEPKRPARRLSQNVCGSHLALIFGQPPLASNGFEQANV